MTANPSDRNAVHDSSRSTDTSDLDTGHSDQESQTMTTNHPTTGTVDPTVTDKTTQAMGDPTVPTPTVSGPATPFRVEPEVPVPDDRPVDPDPVGTYPPDPADAARPAPPWGAHPRHGHRKAWQGHACSGRVTVHRGPRPGSVVLGLLSMLVAAYVLLTNAFDVNLDIRSAGPVGFAALGGLLLVAGLIGVVSGRRRR